MLLDLKKDIFLWFAVFAVCKVCNESERKLEVRWFAVRDQRDLRDELHTCPFLLRSAELLANHEFPPKGFLLYVYTVSCLY